MDDSRHQELIAGRTAPRRSPIWYVAIVAVGFVVLAVGGSFFTAREMNKAADIHNASAGRTGDAKPNGLQEQTGRPETTGTNPDSSVPGAPR